MSRGQTSLAVKGPAVKCHLRSSFSNLGCRSKILRSNVTAVKCPVVKRHWRSNVPRSNVTCGQMSLAVKCPVVKCPAVKCHLRSNVSRSNVPRSNVSCGQMSHRPSVVKCPLWSDVITPLCGQMSLAVYCPAVKRPRSNVPWSNETVVIGALLKSRQSRNDFFKLTFLPKNEQTNSTLLLVDLFSFVFWKKVKTPKRHFEIN